MPGRMTRNSDGVIVLIHLCEICDKVKNQPPDLTAGEFNRGE